jgi:hypothetical protein
MKSYRGKKVKIPDILNLGNRSGQIYALDALPLPPGNEPPVTPLPVTTFWKKAKFLVPAGIRTPDHPVCFVVTIQTWLHWLPTYAE